VEIEQQERAGDIPGIIRSLQRYHADPDTVRAAVQAISSYVLGRPTSEESQLALSQVRLDRIVALYHHSSKLFHIYEHIRYLYF
jgi:hypothetical protein